MTDERDRKPRTRNRHFESLFQRSDDPFFLLDRRRRFLFVNHAWERLTELTAVTVRGLQCQRRSGGAGDPWDVVLRSVCCPPPEALEGQSTRVRRLVPGRGWWDIDFLPLANAEGLLLVLGKITPAARGGRNAPGRTGRSPAQRLLTLHDTVSRRLDVEHLSRLWRPEILLVPRERLLERHGLDRLGSTLPALCARRIRRAWRHAPGRWP